MHYMFFLYTDQLQMYGFLSNPRAKRVAARRVVYEFVFENGFYLYCMVVLSERIKKGFFGPAEFGWPFWGGGNRQAASLTVRSNDYVPAQTWWQIDR